MTDILSSYFMQDAHVAHKKKHIKNLVQVWALFLEEERMLQKKNYFFFCCCCTSVIFYGIFLALIFYIVHDEENRAIHLFLIY